MHVTQYDEQWRLTHKSNVPENAYQLVYECVVQRSTSGSVDQALDRLTRLQSRMLVS